MPVLQKTKQGMDDKFKATIGRESHVVISETTQGKGDLHKYLVYGQ